MPSDEQDFTPPSVATNQPPSKPELARHHTIVAKKKHTLD
jgi:hypothetical protein